MSWTPIVITAVLSSLLTIAGAVIVLKFWVLPAIEQRLEHKADAAAQRIERQIRQRIAQGFGEMIDPLRVRDRATDVARTTADIVGDGMRRVLDRLGGKSPDDRA